MKSHERYVSPESDYYLYSPSLTAQELFLYPLSCGHFIYEQGYSLHRDSYDSFLLLYIEKGALILDYSSTKTPVSAGQLILLDCYKPYAYHTSEGFEAFWCHFDGIMASNLYESIVSHGGNVFSLTDHYIIDNLTSIYRTFASQDIIKEPLLSKYLSDILTELLLSSSKVPSLYNYAKIAEETISYMNQHFAEDISVPWLADKAGLSQYHFIRSFKKETGFTPHEYIIYTRINAAKYLLKNTELPIKEICRQTGFSCESVFCNAFKQRLHLTPIQYRKKK